MTTGDAASVLEAENQGERGPDKNNAHHYFAFEDEAGERTLQWMRTAMNVLRWGGRKSEQEEER